MTHQDYLLNDRKWWHTVLDFLAVALVIGTLATFVAGNVAYLIHADAMVDELKAVKAEIVKTRQYAAQAEINSRWCRE